MLSDLAGAANAVFLAVLALLRAFPRHLNNRINEVRDIGLAWAADPLRQLNHWTYLSFFYGTSLGRVISFSIIIWNVEAYFPGLFDAAMKAVAVYFIMQVLCISKIHYYCLSLCR